MWTKPFFDANKDPIYEDSFVDRATGKALFLSYTGLVYPATLSAVFPRSDFQTRDQSIP